jgi:hypothetical protein
MLEDNDQLSGFLGRMDQIIEALRVNEKDLFEQYRNTSQLE